MGAPERLDEGLVQLLHETPFDQIERLWADFMDAGGVGAGRVSPIWGRRAGSTG